MRKMPSMVLMVANYLSLGFTYANQQLNGPRYVAYTFNLCFTYAPVIKSNTVQMRIIWSLALYFVFQNDRGSPSDPIPNITLFVANFDPILTKNHDIIRHFEPYGKVLGVRQLRDYAFVDFETQEIATKALECTHQR